MFNHTQRRVSSGAGGGFDVWSSEGDAPGPRVVILGGIHGDETHGVLAAGRLANDATRLTRGRVDIVPICHEVAFRGDQRTSTLDDGNLARVFPGDPDGGPTSQIAHHLTTEVLSGADLLIDMHTSGKSFIMPFLAGYLAETAADDSLAKRAATAFGADFVWRHPGRSEGRSLSVVDQAIYVERPGGGPMTRASVDAYVDGVLRVLAMIKMIASGPPAASHTAPSPTATCVTGGGDTDNDMLVVGTSGLFMTDLDAGSRVEHGQVVGTVVSTGGHVLEELRAPHDGWVMALRRRPPVVVGDQFLILAADDD